MRRSALVATVVLVVGAIAAPAMATKPDPETDLVSGHKIWICHATRSLSNPYVKILIDIAAWDVEDPDSNDHGPDHHKRTKDGVTWADYALENPEDECGIDDPPSTLCPVTEQPTDYVIDFGGTVKLYTSGPTTHTVSTNIPGGFYDVTLISGDYDRGDGLVQPNERWRLLGSSPSGYSDDLADTPDPITGQVTTGLSVSFDSTIDQATAEHWSVGTGDASNQNSVVPEYACLTARSSDS